MTDAKTHVAFVCVQNAGRSQIATAYAERERETRGLTDDVVIHSGGTHPADAVHDVVREAMADVEIDLADRKPQEIATETLESCDYVVTMGCSTLDLEADTDVRDWDLPDPHGQEKETVHEIRNDVKTRVEALFDEIEATRTD
ncbi:arsenate-mycothiol transferase ArsC [Natronorubrum bangense]|uniref:Protein-tyrosine phosphatase, low molecular weight n=2 Tax=Natronorubrum bangense TaxID=61858 RepID=L9WS42_9EURY|nr:low molecular weight phosphatase family protein [Natronorubrum bangense]ELY52001.1 Protein-tyrosine phosphatase, low molecular weight [Natronorubrum bangense JCM 10635]QCC54787.1 low molecular weight phosphatase family protein [Natronorubrum bangense]